MTRAKLLVSAATLACLVSEVAASEKAAPTITPQVGAGSFFLAWESCSQSSQSQSFTGPRIYRQFLLGSDLGRPFIGFSLLLEAETMWVDCYTKPDFPDAWRFEPGGCQDGKLGFSATGFSPACPSLEVANRQDWVNVSYQPFEWKPLLIEVRSTFDVFRPNPVHTYTLGQLLYDMRTADAGPGGPTQPCGGADVGMCLTVRSMQLTLEGGETVDLGGYFVCSAWQASSDCWCGYCDPTLPSTWGRLKATFR